MNDYIFNGTNELFFIPVTADDSSFKLALLTAITDKRKNAIRFLETNESLFITDKENDNDIIVIEIHHCTKHYYLKKP